MTLYFVRSKGLKEIKYLTKMMMMVSTTVISYHLTWSIFVLVDIDDKPFYLLEPIGRIVYLVNFGLLFRFVRVQV